MADINATIIRWESGGTLTITDGGTAYVVKNLRPGTLELDLPGRQVVELYDRTTITPIRTHKRPHELRFTASLAAPSADTASGSIMAVLGQEPASGIGPRQFTAEAKVPDDVGGSVGRKWTATDAYVSDRAMRTGNIEDPDEITFALRSCAGFTEGVY